MKILIISGFLGAGKTTFIKELAKRTKKEIAIFENEYGTSGVDGDILKESTKVNIWELTEGCICCSVKGDFAVSVLTIANTVNPEYLVIEPTGVAMLSNLITNLKQIEYEHIKLMAPISIVDALSLERYKNEFPEIYKDQIEFADTVIFSKSENLSDNEKEKLSLEVKSINNSCNIVSDHYSTQPDSWWDSLLLKYLDGTVEIPIKDETAEMPDSFSLNNISVRSVEKFIIFLENLIRGLYGNVFRAKGSFTVKGLNLRFDVADNRYMVELDTDEISDKVVFIGNDIKKQKIREIFFENSDFIKIGVKKSMSL
ncbi:CobW/P47K family protein [Catonella morbi ATCC 51271]|uniref:CobW/P47K family protein n=1 Tax=Catonella morbi ATCC 51271 TaxID=592026 RepID=V2ZBZ9_9FIRM|nr:GTP-binding protein [Catonella morbi]ESL04460.1 CobW/P47K family protein [Catonella morbi ATCC 51271]